MDPNERLRIARKRKKIDSAQQAAERFGWRVSTYQSHENGNRGFKRKDAEKYAKAFGVRVGWLLSGEGSISREGTAQYGGAVGAGEKIIAVDVNAPEQVEAPADIPDAVAYDIRGDSMMPRYEHGWRIFISRRRRELSSFLNRDCVVQLREGEVYLKKLMRGPKPGRFRLRSFSGLDDIEIAESEIDWAAPVEYVKPSSG